MTDTYLLMNKNRPLLSFYSEKTIGGYRLIETDIYVDSSSLPPRFKDINTWVTNRNHAEHKEHLQG
ncbi:MAG: hypothetical protein K2K56_12255 [Lachnospiraceae bacterium]|nr:hypothetical protein [Lachnospiraceae bacterium]